MPYDNSAAPEGALQPAAAPGFPVQGLLCKHAESALYLAIRACAVAPGDLLIVPNLPSNDLAGALQRTGASPILLDVNPENWLIDIDLLEDFLMGHTLVNDADELVLRKNGAVIKGLVVVHLNGNPADLDRLRFIAQRFLLPLIEDGTAAAGALFRAQPVGTFGDTGALALHRRPPAYAAAQGLMLARDTDWLQAALEYGTSLEPHDHALLISTDLFDPAYSRQSAEPGRLQRLEEALSRIPGLRLPRTHPLGTRHSGTLALETEAAPDLHALLAQHHIVTTSLAPPLNHLTPFRKSLYLRSADHASRLFDQVVCIPDVDLLPEETAARIIPVIQQFFLG